MFFNMYYLFRICDGTKDKNGMFNVINISVCKYKIEADILIHEVHLMLLNKPLSSCNHPLLPGSDTKWHYDISDICYPSLMLLNLI